LSTNFVDISDLISQAEAARLRGITRQAVARLVQKGRLKIWTIGGRVMVSRAEIREFTPNNPGRPVK